MMIPGVDENLYNLSYYNEYGDWVDFQDHIGPFRTIEAAELWAKENLNEFELESVRICTIKEDYEEDLNYYANCK